MLYLASRSPRRRRLLRRLRRPFRVVRSTYRETIRAGRSPSGNVVRNATGKAEQALLPHGAKGIILGADTVVVLRRRVIGKPRTLSEARRFLRWLSGRSHWVYTGVCLRDVATGALRVSYEKTKVTLRPLTDERVTRLFRLSSPFDKAGGYALQADRGRHIARIDGSRSNVIGLPMELLRRELRAMGGRSDCC